MVGLHILGMRFLCSNAVTQHRTMQQCCNTTRDEASML